MQIWHHFPELQSWSSLWLAHKTLSTSLIDTYSITQESETNDWQCGVLFSGTPQKGKSHSSQNKTLDETFPSNIFFGSVKEKVYFPLILMNKIKEN